MASCQQDAAESLHYPESNSGSSLPLGPHNNHCLLKVGRNLLARTDIQVSQDCNLKLQPHAWGKKVSCRAQAWSLLCGTFAGIQVFTYPCLRTGENLKTKLPPLARRSSAAGRDQDLEPVTLCLKGQRPCYWTTSSGIFFWRSPTSKFHCCSPFWADDFPEGEARSPSDQCARRLLFLFSCSSLTPTTV